MFEMETFGLFDIIEKKDGYKIEKVIMTSYSFEKALLLPIAYRMDDDAIEGNALLSLWELCKSDKLRVFYQSDKLMGAKIDEKMAPQVEQALGKIGHPIVINENICFHPKITLIIYSPQKEECEDGKYICRLSVASKNLTLGTALEAVLVKEIKLDKEKCEKAFDKWHEPKLEEVSCFINTYFKNVYFQTPNNDVRIIEKMKNSTSQYDTLDCISPGFNISKDELKLEFTPWGNDNNHAKVYIYSSKNNKGCLIWVGSSNCTHHGLGIQTPLLGDKCNYECMACFKTEISRNEIVEKLKIEGYVNEKPSYEENSDTCCGIDNFIKSIGGISLQEIEGDIFLEMENKPKLNDGEKIYIEIANKKIDVKCDIKEYKIPQDTKWISRYVVLCYKNGKDEMQSRTIRAEILGENTGEWELVLDKLCEENLKVTSILSKKGSSSNGYGGDGRTRKTNSLNSMKQNGIFEDILEIYYNEGPEGIRTEKERIKAYSNKNLFAESISEKDIELTLRMLEELDKEESLNG